MNLTFEEIKVPTKTGELLLCSPYVNDLNELEFHHCNLFSGEIVYQNKQKRILMKKGEKEVSIHLENEPLLTKTLESTRKGILEDTKNMAKNLQEGIETIYAYSLNGEPCWFVSETMLERGKYSSKYARGLVYAFQTEAKKQGKQLDWEDYDDLCYGLRDALKGKNLSELKKIRMDGEEVLVLNLPKLLSYI